MTKHRRADTDTTFQDKKARVKTWLTQEGWKINEDTAPDALWLLQIYHSPNCPILIGQPTEHPDALIIQVEAGFVEEFDRHFEKMSDKERREFVWDLRFGLLNMGVQFRGIAEPLHEVQVHLRIFDDALTKDEFLRRLSKIEAALDFTMWMCERRVLHFYQDDTVTELTN
jgi:hypothetical protein